MPAGPRALEVRRPGDEEVLSSIERLRFEPGTVATVAVVGSTAEDCTLVAVRDAAGTSELPSGGVATGAGGGTGTRTVQGQSAPWVLYVGLGSGAVAGTALIGRARRRRDPSLSG